MVIMVSGVVINQILALIKKHYNFRVVNAISNKLQKVVLSGSFINFFFVGQMSILLPSLIQI